MRAVAERMGFVAGKGDLRGLGPRLRRCGINYRLLAVLGGKGVHPGGIPHPACMRLPVQAASGSGYHWPGVPFGELQPALLKTPSGWLK